MELLNRVRNKEHTGEDPDTLNKRVQKNIAVSKKDDTVIHSDIIFDRRIYEFKERLVSLF